MNEAEIEANINSLRADNKQLRTDLDRTREALAYIATRLGQIVPDNHSGPAANLGAETVTKMNGG